MSFLNKIFGDPTTKPLKKIQPIVEQINGLEKDLEKLADDQLRRKTEGFKNRLKQGETLDGLLPEAFAVVREASKRTLKMRHFDVQLTGGVVLHQGKISEMKTGEGKTLVATLPVYLNALAGKGVHVVTVNEYLAGRDAEWMGKVYSFLGLTVGVIYHGQSQEEKQAAYRADVTYGTNNEFGFDYLRDNMVTQLEEMVQRELSYAIVDEVDSILIDEARTPLIISAPDSKPTERYYQFARLVPKLAEGEDYNVDEKLRATTLTEKGIAKIEKLLNVRNIYEEKGIDTVHHIEEALKAHTLFKRDRDYVVKEGEVIIVDEFTGRLMPGRRYSEGLHQAIEAKEGVVIQRESLTLATITFQNYFRMYKKLSGMTGTAVTEVEEFSKIYHLDVVAVPTNKPMIRINMNDKIYKTELNKFKAVARDIKERNQKGQPILVGTASIEKNELLSEILSQEGIKHELLNAKQHEREAAIIAQAGKLGAVTVATNMAGRGVDIILGGNPSDSIEAGRVKELGGLAVIGTERHEARRVDNQLRGRSGRQGDAGLAQFYVSMEDDLMRIFGSDRMKSMMDTLRVPEDQPIEHSFISRSIESAQKRVEGHNFDIRKHLVEYDDVMNRHREVIYKRRRNILEAWQKNKDLLKLEVLGVLEAEIEKIVSRHTIAENENEWDMEEIAETMKTICSLPADLHIQMIDIVKSGDGEKNGAGTRTKLIDFLAGLVKKQYDLKEQAVGPQIMREIERAVLLRTMDGLWIDHLDAMESLREGIGLRGYGQRDPLVEYKREGFAYFQKLLDGIQNNVVYSIFRVGVVTKEESPMESDNLSVSGGDETAASKTITKSQNEPGRNDPCPCGSGKKYKKCHGAGK